MRILMISLMVIGLSACSANVRAPSARIGLDGFKLDPGGVNVSSNRHSGYHCPPGQRKKGRC